MGNSKHLKNARPTSTAKNNALRRLSGNLTRAHRSATSSTDAKKPNQPLNDSPSDQHRTTAVVPLRSPKNDGNRSLNVSADETKVEVGKRYLVRRYGDSLEPAEIVITRTLNHQLEYYARFEGLDRRLDQWVKRDRIMNSILDASEIIDSFNTSVGTITRSKNRRLSKALNEQMFPLDINRDTDELKKESKEITKVKYISKIHLGQYEISTWYHSPFPTEYEKEDKIWMCEYCLKYCKLERSYKYHLNDCQWKEPIGVEIYFKESLSIYEVNPSESSEHKLYCQNLCLLAKFFLEYKYIHYDVERFLFYILCKVDNRSHLIGYFSKEKNSAESNNVACILVLPQFQRQSYGKLLIAFSYELSKLEGLVGGPETPLSDFADVAYRSYWSWVLLEELKNTRGLLSIEELSKKTGIIREDVVSTLLSMNLVNKEKNESIIYVTPKTIEQLIDSGKYKGPRFTIDRNAIKWTPIKEKSLSPEKCVVKMKPGTPKRSRRSSSSRKRSSSSRRSSSCSR